MKFFKKNTVLEHTKIDSKPLIASRYNISKTAQELLSNDQLKPLITQIKRGFSVTDEVWNRHYLFAIERFAEIVQLFPASEVHHHSENGGLLLHTLEALHNCVRISQGYILPPNRAPEDILSSADRWRFGAFIATLSHDIGKIVTDIEVVHRSVGHDNFEKWNPWFGVIPTGNEYTFRYREKVQNSSASKSLHERASMSLLPKLLTKEATDWIFSDLELISEIFSTVSHSTVGGKTIAEIVRRSDQHSVANNLGADTGVLTEHSNAIPLHEKIITSLRNLASEGTLIRNKPGAAIWVTENETWVVSKASMEAVQQQLLSEGHKGIPKNPVRLFDILREHNLIKENPHGDSIWYGLVNYHPTNWSQKLTFLRFENHVLWPTSNPDRVRGEITPVTKEGEPLDETLNISNQNDEKTAEQVNQGSIQSGQVNGQQPNSSEIVKSPIISHEKSPETKDLQLKQNRFIATPAEAPKTGVQKSIPIVHKTEEKKTLKTKNEQEKGQGGASKKQEKTKIKVFQAKQEAVDENGFFQWLVANIKSRSIKCNEKKAPVHIMDDYIAIVTPAIFQKYLTSQTASKIKYDKIAGEEHFGYTVLQKEIEAIGVNVKGINGKNIVRVEISGEKKTSILSVFLLDKQYFKSLGHINVNRAVSKKDI